MTAFGFMHSSVEKLTSIPIQVTDSILKAFKISQNKEYAILLAVLIQKFPTKVAYLIEH
jgi:hypothetical protein